GADSRPGKLHRAVTGIFVQEASATQYPGNIVAWKESGGFAGTFSPNAAMVQTAFPMTAGTTYHRKLQWKANKNAPSATIWAGAGAWPSQLLPHPIDRPPGPDCGQQRGE